MSILDDTVLLLNRNMQPLRLVSVRRAFFLLTKPRKKAPSSKVATVLAVDDEHQIIGPVTWEDWLAEPIRDGDRVVHTAKQAIRVPSIILLAEFDKIVIVNRTMTKSALWDKQKGKDMYTLESMQWESCDMDHYHARSKGGKTSWNNCGLTAIVNNRRKGDKSAKEAGLTLRIPLGPPKPKPLFISVKADPRFPEWNYFIKT